MSEFGNLVRELRKKKGLTVEQVAAKIGSHKGYISGIENGKVNPPSSKLTLRLAQVFKWDMKHLLALSFAEKAPMLVRQEFLRLARSFAPKAS